MGARMLEMILDPNSGINIGDVDRLFNKIANNPVGNPIAMTFLINRWTDIANS